MSAPARIDRVNILLVDDQPAKLLTYQTILGDLGDTLITANSAAEALQHLLRTEIAVVLVDVCMPELDGYELAAMIRQHPRFQRTAIIFVSAVMLTEFDRLRGYEAGAVDYVPVPVVPEILRAKVSVFADLFRKTRALERLNAELEDRVAERTSALAQTTEALTDAARRKDEFLAMLAHELRNPLAPIRTAVQLLRLKELAEPQRDSARDIIERQVEHLVSLIDDLLDVSRITRGVIALQRQPVLLGAIVARAVETARPAIDARRHVLNVEMPDELLTVDGDKTRLVQVLSNILHNAAKFTEPGGRIRLRCAREIGGAVITVADSGVGISAEALPTIFDLFTQSATGPAHPHGGLGIGLALVRRLTEMHGGTVAAHSDGVGHGTTITVTLPVLATQEPARLVERAEPPVPAGPARRILVADDNHDAATALTLQLQLAGHDVRTVYDGLEALTVADAFRPEIVLLDLGMPKLNGYEAARHLRARPWGEQIRIVALTGWGQPQDRARSAEAGFDVHLVKPVADTDLFRALRTDADGSEGTSSQLRQG
jgi:signal transduction histidine kinase